MRATMFSILVLGLLAALVGGCSALNAQQEEIVSNQIANVESFRLDYRAVECDGCGDCEETRDAVGAIADAGLGFDPFKDDDEEDVRAYLERLKAALTSHPPPVSCQCSEDAHLCPFAHTVLETGLRKAALIEQSLDDESVLSSFGSGAFDGATQSLEDLLSSIFN